MVMELGSVENLYNARLGVGTGGHEIQLELQSVLVPSLMSRLWMVVVIMKLVMF